VKLAQAIHAALALSKTPFTAPLPSQQGEQIDLDTKQLDQIIGRAGKINASVYQFRVPRAENIAEGGLRTARNQFLRRWDWQLQSIFSRPA